MLILLCVSVAKLATQILSVSETHAVHCSGCCTACADAGDLMCEAFFTGPDHKLCILYPAGLSQRMLKWISRQSQWINLQTKDCTFACCGDNRSTLCTVCGTNSTGFWPLRYEMIRVHSCIFCIFSKGYFADSLFF